MSRVKYDFSLAAARVIDGALGGFATGAGIGSAVPGEKMTWTIGAISAAAGAIAAFRLDLAVFIKARETALKEHG